MLARDPAKPTRRVLSVPGLFVVMIGTLAFLTLAMCGLIVYRLVASMQTNAEMELDSASREIGMTIDREIAGVTNVLTALIASDSLRHGDIERLYRKAAEVSRQVGYHIVLRRIQRNEQVFNTAFPWGTPPAHDIALPFGAAAYDTLLSGKPVLSDLFLEPQAKRNIVADCVPPPEAGTVEYALCAILDLDRFAEILGRSRLGNNWIVTVIDRDGVIVARSKDHDKFNGKKAGSLDLIKPEVEFALVRGDNAEGVPFVWAYRRAEATGWVVGVGVPQLVLSEPMMFGLGGMVFIGFVVVFGSAIVAHRASSPLARSMRELREAVSAVRREAEPALPAAVRPDSYVGISSTLAAASAELLAVADRRQFMLSAAEVGTWQWELMTGDEVWSDRYREIIGASDEVKSCLENFLARVHPADRPSVAEAVMRHISDGDEYDREYRILRADTGEERWVHAKARLERDRLGRSLRVLGVAMDITVGKQSERERHDLRRRLMRAQEDERLRLSRELHDETGQALAAAMLDLKRLEPVVGPQGRGLLDRLRSQLDGMGKSLHRVARELRPTSIDDLGLAKALADHCADWKDRFGIDVDYQCVNVDLDQLPRDVGTVIYRICQEALTNVARHAVGATDVGIVVDRVDATLRLTIEDNGCGFDPDAAVQPRGAGSAGGLGLAGIRERLALIGGEVEIESSANVGTTVFVRIALETTEVAAWPIEHV
jgi:two-component system, NarL family, sensor histidine kinase UhpB